MQHNRKKMVNALLIDRYSPDFGKLASFLNSHQNDRLCDDTNIHIILHHIADTVQLRQAFDGGDLRSYAAIILNSAGLPEFQPKDFRMLATGLVAQHKRVIWWTQRIGSAPAGCAEVSTPTEIVHCLVYSRSSRAFRRSRYVDDRSDIDHIALRS